MISCDWKASPQTKKDRKTVPFPLSAANIFHFFKRSLWWKMAERKEDSLAEKWF